MMITIIDYKIIYNIIFFAFESKIKDTFKQKFNNYNLFVHDIN